MQERCQQHRHTATRLILAALLVAGARSETTAAPLGVACSANASVVLDAVNASAGPQGTMDLFCGNDCRLRPSPVCADDIAHNCTSAQASATAADWEVQCSVPSLKSHCNMSCGACVPPISATICASNSLAVCTFASYHFSIADAGSAFKVQAGPRGVCGAFHGHKGSLSVLGHKRSSAFAFTVAPRGSEMKVQPDLSTDPHVAGVSCKPMRKAKR